MDDGILLAEENPGDRALALRAIRDANVRGEVVVARDGSEALDYLFGRGAYAGRDTGVQPRVVLLSLTLPGVDGLEVLRRLRADERTKLVPVVVLSSSDRIQDMIDAYESGANSYIRKPTDFAWFAEVVGQTVLYWFSLNELPPEGWTGRRGGGEAFRAAWFRSTRVDRRRLRRVAIVAGTALLLSICRRRTRRQRPRRR